MISKEYAKILISNKLEYNIILNEIKSFANKLVISGPNDTYEVLTKSLLSK